MGWQRYLFQGQNDPQAKKVWAEVSSEEELKVEDGLVKIKFTRSERAKEYTASRHNLSPLNNSKEKENNTDLDPAPPEISREIPDEVDLPAVEEDLILIYTDGATSSKVNHGSGPSGIGAVFWDGTNYKEISQFIGKATNQVAELQAINCALGSLREPPRPVRLYTDSQYAQKSLTQWIHNWRKNGWQNSSGKPVANQRLIKQAFDRMKDISDIELKWVEGHAGDPLNERADTLAVRAVENNR